MQVSGLTEIIPFICISAIWGQHPASWLFTSLEWLQRTAAGSQALFSFLGTLRAQKFTFGGPKSLVAVTSLFTDMTGNTQFHLLI